MVGYCKFKLNYRVIILIYYQLAMYTKPELLTIAPLIQQ
jgi:hypothetical protein